jgi:hypothetical protein
MLAFIPLMTCPPCRMNTGVGPKRRVTC